MINILVTGAGSTLGLGIINTIRSSGSNSVIYGSDYIKNSIGLFRVRTGFLLPDILRDEISEQEWISAIKKIIKETSIDLVLIGLDFEVPLFAKYKEEIEKDSKVKIIVSSYQVVKICNDKWLTYNFLKDNKFAFPLSCLPSGIENFKDKVPFPWIIKPRFGSTSKNIFKVSKFDDAISAIKVCKNSIIQEEVGEMSQEYTCGTIFLKNEIKSSIALKRELKNGNTSIAYNNDFEDIEDYVKKITIVLKPFGPINIQLRKIGHEIKVFEINPRFSGTTSFRSKFGVNEITIILNELFELNCKPGHKKIRYGTVIRYFEEEYISEKQTNNIRVL